MVFYIFIQMLKETSVSKQWRTWSDAPTCDVGSGSVLFTYVHKNTLGLYGLMRFVCTNFALMLPFFSFPTTSNFTFIKKHRNWGLKLLPL